MPQSQITTLEGLAPEASEHVRASREAGESPSLSDLREKLHPTQRDFLESHGFQCGYCTAGFIMTASADDQGRGGEQGRRFKGNLCRCTGYCSITEALDGAEQPRVTEEDSPGSSPMPPAGPGVVTGTVDYTFDRPFSGDADILHAVLVRSRMPTPGSAASTPRPPWLPPECSPCSPIRTCRGCPLLQRSA